MENDDDALDCRLPPLNASAGAALLWLVFPHHVAVPAPAQFLLLLNFLLVIILQCC
jgi:hypothetical protein